MDSQPVFTHFRQGSFSGNDCTSECDATMKSMRKFYMHQVWWWAQEDGIYRIFSQYSNLG